MEIFDLSCFLSVAKHGRFYEAAEELYISQSSLSRNIQSIEKELNVKLFSRKTNGCFLTEAGKAFLPYAESIISEYNRMNSSISYVKDLTSSVLTVYSFSHLVAYNIQQMIDSFSKLNPSIKLNIQELSTTASCNYIANDPKSVAIVFSKPGYSDNFYTKDLIVDSFSAVISKNSNLAAYDELSLNNLKNNRVQIISKEHEEFLNGYLLEQCAAAGIFPDNKSELWYTTLGIATTRYDLVALMPTRMTHLIDDPTLKTTPVVDMLNIAVSIKANKCADGSMFEPVQKLIDFASNYFHND